MKCSLCGYEFRKEEGRAACTGCFLAGVCYRVRCPHCGFDLPLEPRVIKALKDWRRRGNGTRGKS